MKQLLLISFLSSILFIGCRDKGRCEKTHELTFEYVKKTEYNLYSEYVELIEQFHKKNNGVKVFLLYLYISKSGNTLKVVFQPFKGADNMIVYHICLKNKLIYQVSAPSLA